MERKVYLDCPESVGKSDLVVCTMPWALDHGRDFSSGGSRTYWNAVSARLNSLNGLLRLFVQGIEKSSGNISTVVIHVHVSLSSFLNHYLLHHLSVDTQQGMRYGCNEARRHLFTGPRER